MLLRLGRFFRHEHVILSSLAVVVGGISAAAVIAFRTGIGTVQLGAFGFAHEFVITGAERLPWWQLLLVPALGGLGVGLFLHFLIRGGRAHGVADVIAGSALPAEKLTLRDGAVSAVAAAASIGVGASTGREGPVVHLSATLGAWAARHLNLSQSSARTLIGCGTAAAVAASFNAPIAGVFFALEVVVRHHALRAIAPIVISSVTATIISRARYGSSPAFVLPESILVSLWEFPAFVLLGVLTAVLAIGFARAVFLAETAATRSRLPSWSRPAVAGLLVGAIAIVTPQVLGVGYETTDTALRAGYGLSLLVIFVAAKFAATAISLGFGFGGGVFSPALVMGAMVGGAFGTIAGTVFPELYSGASAYAVIGMGALAGAVLGSPMSTILIVFELTGDHTLTVAVMIATVVSSLLTQQLYFRSFFHAQLARRGLSYADSRDEGLLRGLRVADVMDRACRAVRPEEPLDVVRARLHDAPLGEVMVTEEDGRLVGLIGYRDVEVPGGGGMATRARDAMRSKIHVVSANDDLQTALRRMRENELDHAPVVRGPDDRRALGQVCEKDILRALLRARSEEAGEA